MPVHQKAGVQHAVKPGDVVNPAIPLEEITQAIMEISRLGRQIDASRLKRRAVLLLIQDCTGVSLSDITKVLCALPELEATYLKPRVH